MGEKWGIAIRQPHPIVRHVKRYRVRILGAMLAGAGLICAGCGGVQGSHSVSPASFFLPGLIHHEVTEPRPDDAAPVPVDPPTTVATSAKPVAS